MKKNITKVLSIVLALITVFSTSTIGLTASAAVNTNYPSYDAPENSGDYAYWNGSKVVKSSSTTKEEICWAQSTINYCIANEGLKTSYIAVDGSFGPGSRAATIAFQKAAGLTADGSFGPATIKKMKLILSDGKKNSLNPVYTTNNGSSKTLSINWNLIKSTGKQRSGEKNCLCRAFAYSRDIIDGTAHKWTEYSEGYLKSAGRYSYTAVCSKAGYAKKTSKSQATVFKAVYDNINNGKPVVINVDDGAGKRSTGCHYVAVVGYKNVTDSSKLSASNFLIIDSVGNGGYTTENLGSLGYYLLKNSSGSYTYYID